MTRAEKLYWTGAALDLASTAGALTACDSASEANPVPTVLGDGAAEVLVVSAVLNWG